MLFHALAFGRLRLRGLAELLELFFPANKTLPWQPLDFLRLLRPPQQRPLIHLLTAFIFGPGRR